jgi:hypothetical protein
MITKYPPTSVPPSTTPAINAPHENVLRSILTPHVEIY